MTMIDGDDLIAKMKQEQLESNPIGFAQDAAADKWFDVLGDVCSDVLSEFGLEVDELPDYGMVDDEELPVNVCQVIVSELVMRNVAGWIIHEWIERATGVRDGSTVPPRHVWLRYRKMVEAWRSAAEGHELLDDI